MSKNHCDEDSKSRISELKGRSWEDHLLRSHGFWIWERRKDKEALWKRNRETGVYTQSEALEVVTLEKAKKILKEK